MSINAQSLKTLRINIPVKFLDVIVTLVPKLGGTVLSDDAEIIFSQPTEEEETVGIMLRGARVRLGITQKDLAEATGIKQSRISEYEKDKRPIPKDTAVQLSKVLKTVPEHFYRG
ncbi:MAG: helix-turn-helix domain-containing protein [Candidatus Adiutrix sp.]|jgi:DNA-binding XRE family transcriptional regulator|nr:helix-turn-helix domain-containing protein [Candidatus Adiutrix sp.]